MKSSMVDYYENELEMLDLSRTQSGSGSSKSATIKQFVAILQKLSDEKKKILFNYDEIKEIYDVYEIFANFFYFLIIILL